MDEPDYELMEPFDIDSGELDGLRPKDCFVLGVEWQMVAAELDHGRAVERTIHLHNAERIRAMLRRRGRQFQITASCDPGWVFLSVEAM